MRLLRLPIAKRAASVLPAVVFLSLAQPRSAVAQAFGGAGGGGDSGTAGAGGTPGRPGTDGTGMSGGGGGGAGGQPGGLGSGGGSNGGSGGTNGLDITILNNPRGTTVAGGNGTDGGIVSGSGGGSGGGGAGGFGAIVSSSVGNLNEGAIAGGSGGGADQIGLLAYGAGKGGDGGFAVAFTAANAALTNWGSIVAGTGGAGGAATQGGGMGGTGGIGSAFGRSGGTLMNLDFLAGGIGGTGGSRSADAGGTGGTGGIGASFADANAAVRNLGSISGGRGGAGGQGLGVVDGGTGGTGGAGLSFSGAGNTLVNMSTIAGGDGGAGGAGDTGSPGAQGRGGVGIVGSGLTIDNTGGMIQGGTGRADAFGRTRNFAVRFDGGVNYASYGSGYVGGFDVAGGSFRPALPGSEVGSTLSVSGPMVFANGTTFDIRITPTANDSVLATGNAILTGAAVNVTAASGHYTVGSRTILSAGSLTGTFTRVTANFAFLDPTLSYVGNTVVLTIQTGTTTAAGTPTYTTAASTRNQFAAARGLTNAGIIKGGAAPILDALNQLTVVQAQVAFGGLSGEGIAAAQNAAHRSASAFNAAIFDQTTVYGHASPANSITLNDAVALPAGVLSYAPKIPDLVRVRDPPLPPQRTWRAWAAGFGGVENIGGNAGIGSAGQTATVYGGTLGIDDQVLPNYLAGIAIGGSEGDFQVGKRATSGTTTGRHIAFYELATFGSFYGASSNSFSSFGNRTTRTVGGFGGLPGETEKGKFASHAFRTRLEFGRHIEAYGATITPFVALEIAELRSNGFGETSLSGPGNFLLNVSGRSSASVPSFVGARYQGKLVLANGTVLAPILQMAYVHEFAPERSQIGALSRLPGSTFLVEGATPSRDTAQVKAGVELAVGPASAIFATFDGAFSRQARLYGGKGGFRHAW